MDIELFQEFVTLAKYLNFRETSERLNLSQPTLSRHISQLETYLETQLFERDKQSVRLTSIGQAFLPEAQNILNSVEQAMARISAFRKGVTGQLAIGYKQAYGVSSWGLTLSAFKDRYSEIMLDIHHLFNFAEVTDGLTSGKIDVAMLLEFGPLSQDFRAIKLAPVPLCVAINEKSPLAERTELRCEDLIGNVLVFPHTASASGTANTSGMLPSMKKFVRSHGLGNCQVHYSMSFDETLMHVNLNSYIAVVPKCYFPYTSSNFFGTRIFELADTGDMFHLYVLARKNNHNPAVELFFSTCQDVISRIAK